MSTTPHAVREAISPESKVVFVSGNFNIIHPGHLRLLKFAAELADVVVVGVNADSTPGVYVPGEMRVEGVHALSVVHHAFLMTEDLDAVIRTLRPRYIVKGQEFRNRHNSEAQALVEIGGDLVFASGDANFASIDLIRQEFAHSQSIHLRDAGGYPERHGIRRADVLETLHRLIGKRVAVVGDLIVDDYITCEALGMSQEDPTIVVTPVDTRTFVGGAGVVAAHAHNLGGDTHFFSVLGLDQTADFARSELTGRGVQVDAVGDETRPTTRKQRFRAHNKTLLRVNHLRQHDLGQSLAEQLLIKISAVMATLDLLMFADFNYGCLPQDLVEAICKAARQANVPTTADSQASSQMSDISRFRGMTLITPTEREARLAMQDSTSGLAALAENLRIKAEAENVIITLGGEGMLIHGRNRNGVYMTDRIPALNSSPKDVAGAGDSLFTIVSMALTTGADIWTSAYLGAVAAARQVAQVGNSPLERADIELELQHLPGLAG